MQYLSSRNWMSGTTSISRGVQRENRLVKLTRRYAKCLYLPNEFCVFVAGAGVGQPSHHSNGGSTGSTEWIWKSESLKKYKKSQAYVY